MCCMIRDLFPARSDFSCQNEFETMLPLAQHLEERSSLRKTVAAAEKAGIGAQGPI